MGSFHNKPVNKSRHCLLDNSLTLSGVLLVNQRYKKTQGISYFTDMVSGSFGNGPVNKTRHYVLDILLGL